MPATEADLLAWLEELGIAVSTHRHPPVFTVEDAKRLRGELPGGHAKSLLMKDKKGAMALVVVEEDRRLDLRSLAELLSMKRLSFASPERLDATLGVPPGSVTPFALINRRKAPQQEDALNVILDAGLMRLDPLNFHPLHNAATTTISTDDLLRFIAACGYEPLEIDFETMSGAKETAHRRR